MNQATSVFLDLLRLAAAAGVVLVHTGTTGFSPSLAVNPNVGHHCVVIFFVLSGYVIAHATLSRSQSAATYAIARLARLYSVLVPALIVTAALLVAGRAINPAFYAQFDRGNEPLRFALSFLFLNETWWLSAAPPTNSPLWSLAYEFWYYGLFGAWTFAPSRLLAIGFCIAIAGFVGPKILLLLPIWLLGVFSNRLGGRIRLGFRVAMLGIVATLALIGLWLNRGAEFPGNVGHAPHFFSNAYGSDFILGSLVASVIFFFQQASSQWRIPRSVERPIRAGANMTFSLYLLHHPILMFAASAFTYDRASTLQTATILAGIVAFIAGISLVTEFRRRALVSWMQKMCTLVVDTVSGSQGA